MTYTTKEKVAVEEVRFASKMGVLQKTAELETVYNNATRAEKDILTAGIASIKAAAKDQLTIDVSVVLADMREDEDAGGDDNE